MTYFRAAKAVVCSSRAQKRPKAKVMESKYITQYRLTPGAVNILRPSSLAPTTFYNNLFYLKSKSIMLEKSKLIQTRLSKLSV